MYLKQSLSIFYERDLSDKGFEVIGAHEGKNVAKLLKIAYQYNDLIANWMINLGPFVLVVLLWLCKVIICVIAYGLI